MTQPFPPEPEPEPEPDEQDKPETAAEMVPTEVPVSARTVHNVHQQSRMIT
jgi:hypothetical protein